MAYTKEQRLINSMNGRQEIRTPIATEMYIPNNSGDHKRGLKMDAPTLNYDLVNKKYVDDAIAVLAHAKQHSITSALDHTSTATSGRMLKADANGLPVNATNTDTEVSDAVTKKHTRSHALDGTSDHSIGSLTNTYLVKNDGTKLVNATNTDAQVSASVLASHAILTISDTASVNLTLVGQLLSADVLPAGVHHGELGGLGDDDHTIYLLRQPTADVVINDAGGVFDFRIESDTDAYCFMLDADTDRIGIGTASPTAKLDVRGRTNIYGNNTYGFAHYDQTGANSQYLISLHTAASNDLMLVTGKNGASTQPSLSLGTSDTMRIQISSAGLLTAYYGLDVEGASVFNENGGDYDFRIEGDTKTKIFNVDAGLDKITINGDASATSALFSIYCGATDSTGGFKMYYSTLNTRLAYWSESQFAMQNPTTGNYENLINNNGNTYFNVYTGNLGLHTTTFNATGVGVFTIGNGTAPDAHVDNQIQIYSADSASATATLALYLEEAVAAIGSFTADYKIVVYINGSAYCIPLDKV